MRSCPSIHSICRQLVCCGVVMAALLGGGRAVGATSSIVGFYNVSVPAGNSSWVSGLVCANLHEAACTSVTADVDGKALVQFSAPGWTPNAFNLHYAEPQSGSASGLAINILSNTADTLKLNTTPAASGLTSGMVFIVRKHATLGGLLPDGGGFTPFSDTISLLGTTGLQTTYFFNNLSNTWITVLGTDASNAVVRPGQGFVIQTGVARTVVFGKGEVCHLKTTQTRIAVSANAPNLIGAINPLGGGSTTLGAMGMAASMQAFNDSVITLTPGTLAQSGVFLSTGTSLINSGTGASGDTVSVSAGAGVVINVNAPKNVLLSPVSVAP